MICQHCEASEAEVEVDITMPETKERVTLELCVQCAIEASDDEVEAKQNGNGEH